MPSSSLGQRIAVVGTTSSGKSTLGARLAAILDLPLVELDALNWEPGWHAVTDHDPAEFERRLRAATAGDAWVVAGSYSRFAEPIFWDRLQTVVWLDLPLPLVLWRVVSRSWRRYRARELLWGTNYERFWSQLKFWHHDSLVWWALTTHRTKRQRHLSQMADPRWAHIRFIRLTSPAEVSAFTKAVKSVAAASRLGA